MWTNFQDLSTHSKALSVSNPLAMCRLCMLNSGATMEPIFHLSVTSCIADKIANVTRLMLHPGDGLPALVCQQCIFQLDVADMFIQRCTQSDKSLRSILSQKQATSNFEENIQDPIAIQAAQPLLTSGILGEIQECSEAHGEENLSNNIVEKNMEFPSGSGVLNFEAADLLTLPEQLILDEDPMNRDEEYRSDLPTVIIQDANLDRNLICSDPLLDVKHEAILETGSYEENEGIRHSIKMEAADCISSIEDTSEGVFHEDSYLDYNHSLKTEALTGILNDRDMRGDDYEPYTQNVDNTAVITGDKSECEQFSPSNQKQLQPTAKKHPCVICSIELANRWSLIRHIKIHKRKERLEKIRLANAARNNSLPTQNSEMVSPFRKLSDSHDIVLGMSQSANITPSLGAGDEGSSVSASANNAEKISIAMNMLHEKCHTLDTTWRHKCPSCSASFSRKWNLVQHRERHYKKTSKKCLKMKSSNSKQPLACLKTNQLNMTPIVRVTPLVITKDAVRTVYSFQQYNCEQPQTFSVKRSLTGRIELPERMQTQRLDSFEMQKSAGDNQQVNSSSPLLSNKVTDTKIESDYHKKISMVDNRSTKACRVCNLVCRNKSHLQSHMRSHTGEKPFKCMICNKRYQELHSLKRHIRDHTDEREFKCDKCYSSFHSMYQLKFHVNATHKKARATPKKCSHCGKTFSNNWSLKAHLLTHSDAKPWECGQCDVVFKHRYTLLRHQRRLNHECKNSTVQCSTKLFLKDSPKIHKIIELQGNKKKTPKHQESQITSNDFLGTCKNNFKGLQRNTQIFQNSKRTQTQETRRLLCNNDARPHKCGTCGRAFTERFNLKRHSAVHSKERPWKCGICGFTYKFKTSLKKHEQRQHLEQIFSSLEFSTKSNLQKHTQINETTLSADCNAPSVQRKATRATPVLVEKTKEQNCSKKTLNLWSHRCATCGRAFRSFSSLKLHNSTHCLERQWKCDQCNFAFKRRDSLVRHIKDSLCLSKHKSKTSEEVLQTELCFSSDPDILENKILKDFGNIKLSEIQKDINRIHEDFPQIRPEISPKINITIHPKIHEEMHESGYIELVSSQEATALSDIMITKPLEPIHLGWSPQIMSKILTNDHHAKHPVVQDEIKESTDMEQLPKDTTEPSENTNPEAIEPIFAECSLEIRPEIFPENNFTDHFKIHEETALSPLQDNTENAKVINTETREPTFSECSMSVTGSEILTENHKMYGEKNESTHMKPFLPQEAINNIFENIDTKTHKPTVAKCSFDNTSYDSEIQLKAEPELHLKETHSVSEVTARPKQLDDPSCPQQTIDFKKKVYSYKSNTVSVSKNLQEHCQKPFHCKHCDKSYRRLHELIKHKGCHSREHSFHCSQCTVTVNRKSHLRDHIISNHSTINRQKCEICTMEFETNFALEAHNLTHSVQTLDCFMNQPQNFYCQGGKEVESILVPPSERYISHLSSTKEDFETFFHKDPHDDEPQSSILLEALTRPTEYRHVGCMESREITNIQRNENIVHPPFERLAGSLDLRLNDQLNQADSNMRKHNADTSLESKRIDVHMKKTQGNEVKSSNLQHSLRNSDCLISIQEQVANVTCHATSEECKAQVPLRLAQSEEEKSPSAEEKTGVSVYFPDLTSEQSLQHKSSISLKSNPKNLLRHLVVLKNDMVHVGLKNDLIPGNASHLACSSETAQLRVPHFVFTFLDTEFDNKNKQRSLESKPTRIKMQEFLCNICGKRYSGKGLLNRHLKSHTYHRNSFVCQGCNRSFDETGSMGCKCLNS